ncbi:MAG: cell division protein SepF [Candidatus Bathyarchaeia archaeon]|nr:cell division protein SepF [Candidatus Bathyarchaeota archaeon]
MTNPDLGRLIEKLISKRREKAEVKTEEQKGGEQMPPTNMYPPASSKIYLRALSLHSLDDLEKIKSEVKSGNILIIKVEPLAEKSIEDVKRAISELSEFVESIGGDIARLGEERIVLTPPNVQIWKEKSPTTTSTVPT